MSTTVFAAGVENDMRGLVGKGYLERSYLLHWDIKKGCSFELHRSIVFTKGISAFFHNIITFGLL